MRERGVVSVIRTHGAGFHRHNVASLIPSTRQAWAVLMPSPRSASAFSSFTTICSGVCFENFLMVIHSARPHTARTTQNKPLKTNGPKNPDPSTNLENSETQPEQEEPRIIAVSSSSPLYLHYARCIQQLLHRHPVLHPTPCVQVLGHECSAPAIRCSFWGSPCTCNTPDLI